MRRAWHAIARTPIGRFVGIRLASKADPFLLKHSGGRIRLVGSLPTALLSTTGAKSGVERENPIVYFHDGDDVILIASSFGREKNPGWYYNHVAHPNDVRLNGEPYDAQETSGEDRDRLFGLAEKLYPGYSDYKVRTAITGRTIPVMRLTPRSQ
jgi:deazaflavin-dependent oxidoreductase (nitroreductase family)